jgi:lipopolysaccharide transport system ATP-binding protein
MFPVIAVENLSKKYIIGHQKQERYTVLRDVLANGAKRVARKLCHPFVAPTNDPTHEEFWALKDVSFDIQQGDRVGIIGRNGAGKSTLLKILSRITEPTSGRVSIKGRVASLLEVGTGFHSELTGRENIFLNGAILGMSKAEIRKKFDEIVAFAEVERFLDTPVKRYSSGMYVRLAFAVAAHLEPEILIVDEVLAVGDAQFQKKCLSRMDEAASGGRTVLFVSHNMNAIETLCNKIVVLDRGQLILSSSNVRQGIQDYLGGSDKTEAEWINSGGEYEDEYFTPVRFRLLSSNGQVINSSIRNDDEVCIEISGEIDRPDNSLNIGIAVYNEEGVVLFWTCVTDKPESQWQKISKGRWKFICKMPQRTLNQGRYRLELMASLHCRRWILQPGHYVPAFWFSIEGGLSDSPYWMARRPGLLAINLEWNEEKA